MALANDPHPISKRRARRIGVALVAVVAASLLSLDWTAAVPGGVANAARAADNTPSVSMDIGQQFYLEKTMAPVEELPAQF